MSYGNAKVTIIDSRTTKSQLQIPAKWSLYNSGSRAIWLAL